MELRWGADGDTAVGRVSSDELSVQLQLVKLDSSYSRYPTATTQVELRRGEPGWIIRCERRHHETSPYWLCARP